MTHVLNYKRSNPINKRNIECNWGISNVGLRRRSIVRFFFFFNSLGCSGQYFVDTHTSTNLMRTYNTLLVMCTTINIKLVQKGAWLVDWLMCVLYLRVISMLGVRTLLWWWSWYINCVSFLVPHRLHMH